MPNIKKMTDTPEFRKMWDDGVKQNNIAKHFNVSAVTIYHAAARFGYKKRSPRGAKADPRVRLWPDDNPPCCKPLPLPQGVAGDLLRTKGSYGALAAIAGREGWSSARVQQEFHKARASV